MLDLPGTGTEYTRDSPASVAEISDDLRKRFERNGSTGSTGSTIIVAVSLGGMVALDWCARYPSDFHKAVVINTSAGDLSRAWERLDWRNYPSVMRAAASSNPRVRERCVVELTINKQDFDREALIARWTDYACERPVGRATLFRQLFAAARSKLPDTAGVPTLVLGSKGDRLVRPACSERIAEKLKAPLAMHDSGGHDLPFDDAPWVLERIKEFV